MLTKTVDVQEAQTNLKELLSLALKGIEVILTEGGIPLVRLAPIVPQLTSVKQDCTQEQSGQVMILMNRYQRNFGQGIYEITAGYSYIHLMG